jgi:hypothetical protein
MPTVFTTIRVSRRPRKEPPTSFNRFRGDLFHTKNFVHFGHLVSKLKPMIKKIISANPQNVSIYSKSRFIQLISPAARGKKRRGHVATGFCPPEAELIIA